MRLPIRIMEYNPQWPALFEEEKARIVEVIGGAIQRVEHVGSTAVPGLGAKPIIDIMVGVRELAVGAQCVAPLETIGYQYVPEYEVFIPERRYFHKGVPDTHHLHMVELTSAFWERHLLFRDFLRAHPEVAQEYCQLKRHLAARFADDREGYTESKTEFIGAVVVGARLWRLGGSSSSY